MAKDYSAFVESVLEEECLCINYIINNPDKISVIDKADFTNDSTKKIFSTIFDLVIDKEVKTLSKEIIKKENLSIDDKILNDIFDLNVKDESIVKDYIGAIKEYPILIKLVEQTEKFLTTTTEKKRLNKGHLVSLIRDTENLLFNLEDTSDLYTMDRLGDMYRKVQQERQTGRTTRNFGFSPLTKLMVRPAAAGEMTTILGMKGSGKSILCKAVENSWISQGVCVVSLNMEMSWESNYDRLISMREKISLEDILKSEKDRRLEARIEAGIKRLEENPYYIYYKEPEVSLEKLEELIIKAKNIFKARGVLPEDGYFVLVTDLTEQIEELTGKFGTDLKPAVNKLSALAKKYNFHKVNILQSTETIMRSGKMFSTPESCDAFTVQTEHVEGGSAYAARSRVVLAVNRPLLLKKRFFPAREDEWNLMEDILWVNVVKQNDSRFLGRTPFIFHDQSFCLYPYIQQ